MFGLGKQKKVNMTPEQMMMQHQIDELKAIRRGMKTDKLASNMEGIFKKLAPKGIASPDKIIRNQSLYAPKAMKNIHIPKRLRLF